MIFYFLFIRIAALFGHRKAHLLVRGQKHTLANLKIQTAAMRSPLWIHVSSVGEFEQARPLIEKLQAAQELKAKGERIPIILTFFSPSGYELRKNYNKADGVYYLPFATRRNARWFLNTLQPRMALFVKYEFWPAYLRELKKRGIPTYSISAIFRPEQLFFRWWGKSYLRLLNCFTHIYAQDEASRILLANHGIRHCSVVGDTRFDRVADVRRQLSDDRNKMAVRLAPIAHFVKGCERVIVAGSTWPKDEELLTAYITNLELQAAETNDSTKLILVPHETDEAHLHFIFNLLQGRFLKYSSLDIEKFANDRPYRESMQNILQKTQILVIDTIGLLSSIYQFGHTAYVGGGFGVGIHNTIEAAVYGVPVVFGPNYQRFREAKGLIEAGAARSISNYQELESALNTALEQHELIGAKAAAYVAEETGATEKIYKELFDI